MQIFIFCSYFIKRYLLGLASQSVASPKINFLILLKELQNKAKLIQEKFSCKSQKLHFSTKQFICNILKSLNILLFNPA